jgi:hypothetical protein
MSRGKNMAQILNFRTPELRSGEGDERRQSSSAEIILFPGIRYERWGEPRSGASGEQRAACRDVLELAE